MVQEREVKKMKEDGERDTKTTVTIPYIKGVSEALSQVFCHHGVPMAIKPHLTLKKTGAQVMNHDGGWGVPPTSTMLHQAAVL